MSALKMRNNGKDDLSMLNVNYFEENGIVWFEFSGIYKTLEVDKDTAYKWKTWFDNDEIKLKNNPLGEHSLFFISESALYRILNRCNSPKAKLFERKVTKEILPSIRNSQSKSLESNNFNLRVMMKNNNPNDLWFVGKDVAEILEYKDVAHAIYDNVNEKDTWLIKMGDLPILNNTNGLEIPNRGLKLINESGLYTLILKSKAKNALKFQHWITSEVLPSIRKTGTYAIKQPLVNQEELKLKEHELHIASANIYLKLAEGRTDRYGDILKAYATKELSGEFLLPLPKSERKTLSATDIGLMLGVSANKVGQIANKNNLKTDDYGEWFIDKSKYSNKEVRTFRYYENTVNTIKNLMGV